MNERTGMPGWVVGYFSLWLAIAILVSATGRLATLAPPRPQMIVLGLTILLVVLGRTVPSFRAWLHVLSPRVGIAIHLVRFVGFYFLWLSSRGELVREFGVPAGIGDIVVAFLAVWLLLSRESHGWYRAALAWNVLGLIDLLFVIFTATRLALANSASMNPLLHLPLSLLPTFIVPILIASHLWLFGRLRATAARA